MRFGIISDIHANLVALDAVLADMGPVDQYWCLGDVVGYGPQPNECIQRLLDLDHAVVMGNHDAAAVGEASVRTFNGEARRAIQWTASVLSRESLAYLETLPERLEHDDILLVHGSVRDPIWEYVTTREQASELLAVTEQPYTLSGHTHIPAVFVRDSSGAVLAGRPDDEMELRLVGEHMIVNPGSVGQPRDGDPRAGYALIDTERMSVQFHRVEYDISETQRRMREVGAGEWLVERLAHGR